MFGGDGVGEGFEVALGEEVGGARGGVVIDAPDQRDGLALEEVELDGEVAVDDEGGREFVGQEGGEGVDLGVADADAGQVGLGAVGQSLQVGDDRRGAGQVACAEGVVDRVADAPGSVQVV